MENSITPVQTGKFTFVLERLVASAEQKNGEIMVWIDEGASEAKEFKLNGDDADEFELWSAGFNWRIKPSRWQERIGEHGDVYTCVDCGTEKFIERGCLSDGLVFAGWSFRAEGEDKPSGWLCPTCTKKEPQISKRTHRMRTMAMDAVGVPVSVQERMRNLQEAIDSLSDTMYIVASELPSCKTCGKVAGSSDKGILEAHDWKCVESSWYCSECIQEKTEERPNDHGVPTCETPQCIRCGNYATNTLLDAGWKYGPWGNLDGIWRCPICKDKEP